MSVLRNGGSPHAHIDQIPRIDTLIDVIAYDDRPTLLLDTTTRRIRFCNIAFDSLLQGTAASPDLEQWLGSICAAASHHSTHEPIDLVL